MPALLLPALWDLFILLGFIFHSLPQEWGFFGWLDKAGDVICVVSLLTVLSGACTEIHKILAWPDLSSAASQTNL